MVARVDLTDVTSMENDHGNVCDDDIMTLAPPGAKGVIFELLHNPDEKHLTETDEVYLHRTFWEAQYVMCELKAQQKAREQAESRVAEHKSLIRLEAWKIAKLRQMLE